MFLQPYTLSLGHIENEMLIIYGVLLDLFWVWRETFKKYQDKTRGGEQPALPITENV